MECNTFNTPVMIIVGLGFPTEVRTVAEAYALLSEWSLSKKEPAHAMALKACKAALCGDVEAETARGLFVAFARKHDALAPDFEHVPDQADLVRIVPAPI
ncbi:MULTISPECIES: DUF982 domain-containing protein [Phyllobacterium]|jgi:hypothetical protein|uniref:DUF982 domain-containing protein n=1 Tax=Phyllobacterium TaxID=28100 RepID=UPI001CCD9876|nr:MULTISPECIES: DUF982 domain-containing protein [unclassified Phyllobacterium]MBZ9606130.1 DUF982 domain-containing protein [Phyllobacterium sp. KW56]